ncbi:MAG: hypothetical protein HY331_15710 [Chloroflexi bacterium]|nr:hypothetical protein [Chloroflexota bacterium]
MIDIHHHILPDVDDGAETIEEAVAMARAAAADGISTIVATPHSSQWGYDCTRDATARRVAELQQRLAAEEVPVEVLVGVEAYMTPDLVRLLDAGHVFPLAGSRYLLVELPMHQYPPCTDQLLFEIQLRGIVPILAHPERNASIQRDPQRFWNLVDRGILAQMNAASLTGTFGREARETARKLLQHGLIHFLATDAHTSRGARRPVLTEGLDEASTILGGVPAQALVQERPAAIVANADLVVAPPEPFRTGWRSWAFWKR